jgi:hypothetical protein
MLVLAQEPRPLTLAIGVFLSAATVIGAVPVSDFHRSLRISQSTPQSSAACVFPETAKAWTIA